MRWWPFLREGLRVFQNDLKWDKTDEDYLKMLMFVLTAGDDCGGIFILVSGGGQPYGYLVCIENTAPFCPRSVNIYAIHTNNKCPSTVAELSAEAQQWAISKGFKEVYACSYRMSGAAIYWFEKKMKFRRKYMVFSKKLC